jgi:hypothetical protein
MCIFEVAEVLWLRRIRGSNLARLDLQPRLSKASTREQLFVCPPCQHQATSQCARSTRSDLHSGQLGGWTSGFCFFGSERTMMYVLT